MSTIVPFLATNATRQLHTLRLCGLDLGSLFESTPRPTSWASEPSIEADSLRDSLKAKGEIDSFPAPHLLAELSLADE